MRWIEIRKVYLSNVLKDEKGEPVISLGRPIYVSEKNEMFEWYLKVSKPVDEVVKKRLMVPYALIREFDGRD